MKCRGDEFDSVVKTHSVNTLQHRLLYRASVNPAHFGLLVLKTTNARQVYSLLPARPLEECEGHVDLRLDSHSHLVRRFPLGFAPASRPS
jgi:hypothetical protein